MKRAAVHGLASLAANLKKDNPSWNDPNVVAVLIDTSKSDNADLRLRIARLRWNFGRSKGERAADANARRRARRCSLQRRSRVSCGIGDAAALPVIKEMLDPNQELATKEEDLANRPEKQCMIHATGLQCSAELAKKNPDVDLQPAATAVEQLTKSDFPDVRGKAREVQKHSPHVAKLISNEFKSGDKTWQPRKKK